jgi:hypothetical protein
MPACKFAHLVVGFAPVVTVFFHAQRGLFEHGAVLYCRHFGARIRRRICIGHGRHLRGTGLPEQGAQDGHTGLNGAVLRFEEMVNVHLNCPKKKWGAPTWHGLPMRRAVVPKWHLQSVKLQTHYGRDNSEYGCFGDQARLGAVPQGLLLFGQSGGGLKQARRQLQWGGCAEVADLTRCTLVLHAFGTVSLRCCHMARVKSGTAGARCGRILMIK